MPKAWVFDSSPLIILGKIQALDLLMQLPGTVAVPKAVITELLAGKATDPARAWARSKKPPFKKVSVPTLPSLAPWDLGPGESEVISYAKTHPGVTAVLDDRLGRSCANSLKIPVKGTIGLLLWLKARGKIPALKPHLKRISETDFWLEPALIQEALRLAGEKDS